jgi:beta-aspartyl-peptidase (threonine type)
MHRKPIAFRLLTTLFALLISASALAAEQYPYQRFFIGDANTPTPNKVSPGLLLAGGGDRNRDAVRWFLNKAGNGHVVVLSASYTTEIADEFYKEVGGVASVETFLFSGREDANRPEVLAALAKADGIFISGGDQARYVRYWRDTPIAAALDAHVRAGKPLGGTSAGLAMLGEYLYGAMNDGSLRSDEALADPLGAANTIETNFLHLPLLKGVITDTHFTERNRLGRLFAFVAKAEALSGKPIIGIGVDQSAALAVEGDGSAHLYATDPHGSATVVHGGFDKQQAGQPMNAMRIDTVGVGVDSVLHLPEGRVDAPVFHRSYRVQDGQMSELPAE